MPIIPFEIIDGDSKQLLLPQLSDIGRISPKTRPTFRFKARFGVVEEADTGITGDLFVLVEGLRSLDGTGHNWLVSGYVPYKNVKIGAHWRELLLPMAILLTFEARYNTNLRDGAGKILP